jgi:hypothetical protein
MMLEVSRAMLLMVFALASPFERLRAPGATLTTTTTTSMGQPDYGNTSSPGTAGTNESDDAPEAGWGLGSSANPDGEDPERPKFWRFWRAETGSSAFGAEGSPQSNSSWTFAWNASGSWFSTRDHAGTIRKDGGWVFYAMDIAGVSAFGSMWPWVARSTMALLGIGGLGGRPGPQPQRGAGSVCPSAASLQGLRLLLPSGLRRGGGGD